MMSAAENFSPRIHGPFCRAASSTSKVCVSTAPRGRTRGHFEFGEELDQRRLDATRRKEQPLQISRAQRIGCGRRQIGLGITVGNIGADRRGFPERGLAVLQPRHLAHRVDRQILRRLLRAGRDIGQHAFVWQPGFFQQPYGGERTGARRPVELDHGRNLSSAWDEQRSVHCASAANWQRTTPRTNEPCSRRHVGQLHFRAAFRAAIVVPLPPSSNGNTSSRTRSSARPAPSRTQIPRARTSARPCHSRARSAARFHPADGLA